MQQEFVIIVAGGTGTRMQSSIPKQFIEIGGQAIIVKTIHAFISYNAAIKIIISIHPDFKIYLEEVLKKQWSNTNNIQIVLGGDTRFQSVKNGLGLVDDENGIVAIHDAARPFVSLKTIQSCFDTAKEKGNASPCIMLTDSIRQVNENLNSSVKREQYRIIQTPQCFLVSKIKQAFKQEYKPEFTDDASVLESIGEKINLVEGNVENIKITSPFDLEIAKILINNE